MAHTRRGTRITCRFPVTVTALDASNWFSELGQAIVVNPRGCAVQMHRPVEIGTAVLLEGLPANRMVSARVSNCAFVQGPEKSWVLGLELHESGNVWGIEFPPGSWSKSKTRGHGDF